MTRILFLGHGATRSGAPIFLLNLVRWLRDHGDATVEVVLAAGGPLEKDYRELCPTTLLESPPERPRGVLDWREALRARSARRAFERGAEELRARPVDLIYANTVTLGRLTAGIRRGSVPVVTHVHEMTHWIERAGAANLELVRAETTRYVAASRAVRDVLTARFGIAEERIEVVHEFIPCPPAASPASRTAARQRLGIDGSSFVVVGSGHETWRKGKDLFVRLAAECRIRSGVDDARFLWVGGWDSEEARRATLGLVEELGVGDRVQFVGEIASALDHFAAADAFAMVSREDPFPLVCLEAAALEVPIVCFAGAGGAPELVEEDAGRVVGHLDVAAMAGALSELASDPETRLRFGRRAAQKVRERHTLEQGAPRIRNLLASVLAAGRS